MRYVALKTHTHERTRELTQYKANFNGCEIDSIWLKGNIYSFMQQGEMHAGKYTFVIITG